MWKLFMTYLRFRLLQRSGATQKTGWNGNEVIHATMIMHHRASQLIRQFIAAYPITT